MATLILDVSKINNQYKKNMIYTNTVQLEFPINVKNDLEKVYNKTRDQFGSTKTETNYVIKPKTNGELEKYCRALSDALRAETNYDVHILTKRTELWTLQQAIGQLFSNLLFSLLLLW
jgi:hypothetical protein